MHRTATLVSAFAMVVHLGASSCLDRIERTGFTQRDVVFAEDLGGTLYLPDTSERGAAPSNPVRKVERPPAAVLVHGLGSHRRSLSFLARELAESGYAALTIDVQSRESDRRGLPSGDSFYAALSAAVDYLRASQEVDGSRIVLIGHSMGAAASLLYSTRLAGVDGAVMISGGAHLEGPHHPRNALFLFASGDPEFIRDNSRRVAARVAGVPEIELSRTFGSASEGTAVRAVEIPDTDHTSIVASGAAAREIVAWLDGIFRASLPAHRVPGEVAAPLGGRDLRTLPHG
jgi:dienelactone hydrolase